jgi:peptidoglycan hydrolase CwlO-like protein
MAVMKKSVRKKLSKHLARLVKKHGPEVALALVSGILSSLAADNQAKADRKTKAGKAAKVRKAGKTGKKAKADRRAKAEEAKPKKGKPDKARSEQADGPEAGRKPVKAPAKPAVAVGKRAER